MGTAFSRQPGDVPGDFDQPAVEVAQPTVSPATTQVAAEARVAQPYPPSWVDRLTDWVQRLPFPSWAFYLAVGLVLSLVYLALLLWSTGGPTEQFPLYTIVVYGFLNGMTCAYLPGMIHYLDNWAAAALASSTVWSSTRLIRRVVAVIAVLPWVWRQVMRRAARRPGGRPDAVRLPAVPLRLHRPRRHRCCVLRAAPAGPA